MSIREVAEARAKFRAQCRVVADELMTLILDRLDREPEELHGHIVSMLMSELQIAARKTKGE
jgi:hypothetical protein